MSSKPDPADDDASLFRDAMRGVQPMVRRVERVAPQRPPPSARPRQSEADEQAVLAELLLGDHPDTQETGETLAYRAPGVQDGILRRLRRGQYRVEGELDLHGLNRVKAQMAVQQFLARCHERDRRCVRIITGKGNGSPNSGPVIKGAVDGWLRRRADVVAFCSARPEDGGSGAVYVLLRAPRQR